MSILVLFMLSPWMASFCSIFYPIKNIIPLWIGLSSVDDIFELIRFEGHRLRTGRHRLQLHTSWFYII